jgi:ABC-2 type transport system ATP-binding protein
MEEAQELCDRVGIIEAGQLVALDTPRTLIQRYAPAASSDTVHRQPDLEDVFLALTGRGLAEGAADVVGDDAEWLVRAA